MTQTAATPPAPAPRPLAPFFVAGVLLGTAAFLFGGYAALPAMLGIIPRARRLGAFAIALLLSVPAWMLFAAVIGNPLVWYARERVLDRLEAALGERPDFLACSGEPLAGTLRFRQLMAGIPRLKGSLRIHSLELKGGFAYLAPVESVEFWGEGGQIELETDPQGLLDWGKSADLRGLPAVWGSITQVRLALLGPEFGASFYLDEIGLAHKDGLLELEAAPTELDLAVLGRVHRLETRGDLYAAVKSGQAELRADLKLTEPVLGSMLLTGVLGDSLSRRNQTPAPGGFNTPEQLPLHLIVDSFKIAPLWARYRTMDALSGEAHGMVYIGGENGVLSLRPRLDIRGLRYFHRAAMRLNEDRAFAADDARLQGELLLKRGAPAEFRDMALLTPSCTLATGQPFNARGSLAFKVSGHWQQLTGEASLVVGEGVIDQPVRFTGLGDGLATVAPNIVDLAELFAALDAKVEVEVKDLILRCDPLFGRLAGKLQGAITTRANERPDIRMSGRLDLSEGRFEFLAAGGEARGYLEFQPATRPAQATIRGELKGTAGEVPIQAEVTGRLGATGIIFKRVAMEPEKLGRHIVEWGEEKLTAAQRGDRLRKLNRLCGPSAVAENNPFTQTGQRGVYYEFRPGD